MNVLLNTQQYSHSHRNDILVLQFHDTVICCSFTTFFLLMKNLLLINDHHFMTFITLSSTVHLICESVDLQCTLLLKSEERRLKSEQRGTDSDAEKTKCPTGH